MKLNEIDQNLEVQSTLDIKGLKYRNVLQEPFAIYGLYHPKETGQYMRLPLEKAEKVSPGVASLSTCTAGGRIRFRTDSNYVAVKVRLKDAYRMPHMPLTGSHGLDLYVWDGVRDLYQGSFIPPVEQPEDYEAVVWFPDGKMREITVNMPLYSGVEELLIGLNEKAQVEPGRKYLDRKPVLYYGSSITQGGCVSRPGNHYCSAIARETNVDFVCLGFSGGAKGEQEMLEYLVGMEASVFVCDYDHNAPSWEHLQETHLPLYKYYREVHPEVPVIFVSRPNIRLTEEGDVKRRDIVYQTYRSALEAGDKNVYFVDGFHLFTGNRRYDCTVDGTHPNDLGFFRMAEVIGELVKHCLGR